MSHVGASFWENYVLLKFVVLLMFIITVQLDASV